MHIFINYRDTNYLKLLKKEEKKNNYAGSASGDNLELITSADNI